ncbi:MAG: RluA family pseudouridine synthase [Oribacterium sinus]|uniref:RNA pseudouridylate synthase n=1 Tax=Oribacterium sinus TaxID=237576 RepID=A0A930H1Q1_9FIRM|nr:RluA family pseudouridine synthase [Oribacterium sinus]
MREILISQNEKEQKLLKLLQKYFKGQADSFLYKMLRKKNILLNGKKADGKEILQLGDTVQLYFSEESLGKLLQERESTEKELWTQKWQSAILYEDNHCILFNKPVGLLSENDGSSSFSVNSLLLSYMRTKGELSKEQEKSFRPGIANRLDRNTSGIIIFGKSLGGLQAFAKLLQSHDLEKKYYALVYGDFQKTGLQEHFLEKDKGQNKALESERGKRVKSAFEKLACVESSVGPLSLLSAQIFTGKTHQIRTQLSLLSHPIVGDDKYGDTRKNARLRKTLPLSYQLLHAYSLRFPKLPESSVLFSLSEKCFFAPLPKEYLEILKSFHLDAYLIDKTKGKD